MELDYIRDPSINDYQWYVKGRAAWQATYKEELRPSVEALSNSELLDEYGSLAGGDDYDGCYTSGGYVAWSLVAEEMEKRLREIGFLQGSITDE